MLRQGVHQLRPPQVRAPYRRRIVPAFRAPFRDSRRPGPPPRCGDRRRRSRSPRPSSARSRSPDGSVNGRPLSCTRRPGAWPQISSRVSGNTLHHGARRMRQHAERRRGRRGCRQGHRRDQQQDQSKSPSSSSSDDRRQRRRSAPGPPLRGRRPDAGAMTPLESSSGSTGLALLGDGQLAGAHQAQRHGPDLGHHPLPLFGLQGPWPLRRVRCSCRYPLSDRRARVFRRLRFLWDRSSTLYAALRER